jgi:hypothetical protein
MRKSNGGEGEFSLFGASASHFVCSEINWKIKILEIITHGM